MKHITFYLDFISPYAWLALEQMPKALQGLSYHMEYRPVLLGALLQADANPGPAGIPVPGRPVGLRSQAGAIPRGFHTRAGPCGGNERAYATQSRLNTRITLLGC